MDFLIRAVKFLAFNKLLQGISGVCELYFELWYLKLYTCNKDCNTEMEHEFFWLSEDT